jgi:cytochrome c biogenesis protein CcmG, thiol:disulfide interchange protein DsbE
MKRLIFLAPLALFLAVAGYFLFGLGRDPAILPSALIGTPAPEFALPPLEGRTNAGAHDSGFTTADLKTGEPQLVNVWASWCPPCRVEHPLITALTEEHGLTVNGINYKDEPDQANRFLDKLGDAYARVGVDRDGRAAIEWGVYGVPETYVVDGDGIVRYRFPGALTPEVVERDILPLIEKLRR